jgi:hypothetical protein
MAQTRRPLTAEERRRLQLYRRAAGKVYERLGPYAGHRFQARLFRAHQPDDADLIPESDFLALLTSFRLVYAQKEPSHFSRIANVAWLVGDDEVRQLVAQFREDWREIPARPMVLDLFGEYFRPASLLDTWLNGEVFHQDEELLGRVDALRRSGPVPLMILQQTVRDLCFPILGLDNACALILDEELRPVPDTGTGDQTDRGAG